MNASGSLLQDMFMMPTMINNNSTTIEDNSNEDIEVIHPYILTAFSLNKIPNHKIIQNAP